MRSSGTGMLVAFVALGSAIGGVARMLMSLFLQQRAGTVFPVGTLIVNVVGSLILGFIARYAVDTTTISPELRAFLTTGLCGGFTTFSAFAGETAGLVEEGDYGVAAVYVGVSVLLSLAAIFAGFALARAIVEVRRA